jgi:hypothetical protein
MKNKNKDIKIRRFGGILKYFQPLWWKLQLASMRTTGHDLNITEIVDIEIDDEEFEKLMDNNDNASNTTG